MADVIMPQMGESIFEGTITKWLKKPGDKVEVMPDDYGKVPVAGEIVALSPQHIAIRRHDPRAGTVVVHFPRAGFLVFSTLS